MLTTRKGLRISPCIGPLLLVLASGCSNALQPVERGFEPGESVGTNDALRAEVAWVRYEEELVTVRTELRNRGAGPIAVERGAMVLAFDGLEYPPDPERSELGALVLEGKATSTIELTYRLARPMHDRGALWLRGVHEHGGERWFDPVRLALPPAPTPPDDPRAAP